MNRKSTKPDCRNKTSAQASGTPQNTELRVISFDASKKEETVRWLRGLVTDSKGQTLLALGKARGIIEGKQALKNISPEKAEEIRAELGKLGAVIRIAVVDEAPKKNGQHIVFGHYPQTAEGNDSTPIEWRVLDVQGDKTLVISEYGLDAKPYNTGFTDVTWETCTLRKWLNSDFLSTAFDSRTQNAILTTSVDNSKSQGDPSFSTDGGNNTQDKVFLLSYAEAKKYLTAYEERRCAPTDYAVEQGAYTNDSFKADGKATGWWWLRSPGSYSSDASNVIPDGSLGLIEVSHTRVVIRPALWLNLNSVH